MICLAANYERNGGREGAKRGDSDFEKDYFSENSADTVTLMFFEEELVL